MERAQLARRAARRERKDLARSSPTPGGRDLDQDARRAGRPAPSCGGAAQPPSRDRSRLGAGGSRGRTSARRARGDLGRCVSQRTGHRALPATGFRAAQRPSELLRTWPTRVDHEALWATDLAGSPGTYDGGSVTSSPIRAGGGPLIVGIESSCDETGVGIVRGHQLLANEVASSVELHVRFGGVVPEVASRAHLEAMVPTLQRACANADIDLSEIDGVAVTVGPGLMGALVVGLASAKALAYALNKPLYAVNHLVGHVAVDLLEHGPLPERCIALLVS